MPVDLRTIRQDVHAVATAQDHLVPWKAAWRITQLVGGSARFVLMMDRGEKNFSQYSSMPKMFALIWPWR